MVDPENRTNLNSPSSTGTTSPSGSSSSQREEVKGRAQQTADEVKGAAQQRAEGMFEQQKNVAAEQTEKLSTVFRKMAKEFDAQDQRYFSGYANNLARATDSLSQRLREKDLGSLITQVQDYSRRQPAVFLGGAVAVGFVLARFLRSSNERGTSGTTSTSRNANIGSSSTSSPGSSMNDSASPSGPPSSTPY